MMFFVSGDYTIRKGTAVGQGSITFHPAGWVHGPHPGGTEASIADPDYFRSWATHALAGR